MVDSYVNVKNQSRWWFYSRLSILTHTWMTFWKLNFFRVQRNTFRAHFEHDSAPSHNSKQTQCWIRKIYFIIHRQGNMSHKKPWTKHVRFFGLVHLGEWATWVVFLLRLALWKIKCARTWLWFRKNRCVPRVKHSQQCLRLIFGCKIKPTKRQDRTKDS